MRLAAKGLSFAKACVTRNIGFDFEMIPHCIRRASVHKLSALAYTEFNRRFPRPDLFGFPSVLQIEPTNLCNLRCPLCASGVRAFTRPTGMLQFGLYNALLDEIGKSLSLIVLWNWGEPFLNPDIYRMIRRAKEDNIAVITSSNGQSIADRSSAEEIVSSGLDTLAVAIDGATQETYSKYRVGGSLDRALDALRMVSEVKMAKGSDRPFLNVRVVVTRNNEHELQGIRDLASTVGADTITFRSASMPSYSGSELDSNYAPENEAYRMYEYSGEDSQRRRQSNFICRRPWKRLTVNWDGEFIACEHDFDASMPFGSFPKDGSAIEIYNSPRARLFRKQFLADRTRFAFCASCPYADRVTEDCTVESQELRAA